MCSATSTDAIMEHVQEPQSFKDRFIFTYVLFYLLGVVTNISGSFFTSANDYWTYKFRDLASDAGYSSSNKTDLQAQFTSDFNIASNVSYVVFILFTIHFARHRLSILQRSIGSLSLAIAMFVLTCIFVKTDTDSWQHSFFVVTLVIGVLLTGACGMFMVTLYELALKFPRGMVPAIFSGQSICGIFAALTQIFALGVGGGPETSGLIYFVIGTLVVVGPLVALVIYWKKSDYFRYYLDKDPEVRRALTFDKEVILSGANKIKYYMISMVVVLACSVMLHPGVVVLVESMDKGNGNPWNDTFFGPVINFFFYNLLDYVGREVALYFKKPTNGKILLALSLVRVPLVPIIMFCNAQPRSHLSVVFDADYAYILFLFIFAFSNGYLVNMSLVRVPLVTDEKERPFAMLLILLLMILSLAISSVTSSALVNAL